MAAVSDWGEQHAQSAHHHSANEGVTTVFKTTSNVAFATFRALRERSGGSEAESQDC